MFDNGSMFLFICFLICRIKLFLEELMLLWRVPWKKITQSNKRHRKSGILTSTLEMKAIEVNTNKKKQSQDIDKKKKRKLSSNKKPCKMRKFRW